MFKKILFAVFVVCLSLSLMSATGYADGRAKISLQPDSGGVYVNENSDPWLTETWLTHSKSFDLDITSSAKSPIYLTRLVLSMPYDTANTGWSFTLGGSTFNYASFSSAGLHPFLSPHGIFEKTNGALWTEYSLGTLVPGQTLSIAFNDTGLPHDMLLHFDAYGSKSATKQDGWYFTPFSHDAAVTVSVTPEPVSSALFLLGGGLMALRRYRRKK